MQLIIPFGLNSCYFKIIINTFKLSFCIENSDKILIKCTNTLKKKLLSAK